NLSAIPHGCLLYLAIKYAPVYRSFLLRITLPNLIVSILLFF
ncbi:hypothetical protein AAKU52_002894, partial [Pedobacter sp. CG_S7]